MADQLEISGLVLRLDYPTRTLVNFENAPQTNEIIHLLGEAYNERTDQPCKQGSIKAC